MYANGQRRQEVAAILDLYRELDPADRAAVIALVLALIEQRRAPPTIQ